MSREKIVFLCLILIFTTCTPSLAAESDYPYGVHLFKTGDYEAAALELGRFVFHNPQNIHSPHAHLLLGLSYANTNRYNRALFHLFEVEKAAREVSAEGDYSALVCESSFHVLSILFREKKTEEFQMHKERLQVLCPDLDQRLNRYIESMSVALWVYNTEWKRALKELEASAYIQQEVKHRLKNDLEDQLSHRDKSPVLGGALSILPGFGHFYAGRWGDGVRSLLVNGAFVSLTYLAFKEDMPLPGGILACISGVLYISNIYGGINAVLQENARFTIEKRNSMLKAIGVPRLDVITLRKELDL